LTHDNAVGESYALRPWSSPGFSTSSYSDAANRIAWAIENGRLSCLGSAATQLLIWSIIDNGLLALMKLFLNIGAYSQLTIEKPCLVGTLH